MNNHSFKMFHESSILFINGQSSGQTCSWISEIYIYTTRCILLLIIYKPLGGFISLGFSPLFTLFVIYILFCFCGNMLWLEVRGCYVAIGRIVDHRCLNSLVEQQMYNNLQCKLSIGSTILRIENGA